LLWRWIGGWKTKQASVMVRGQGSAFAAPLCLFSRAAEEIEMSERTPNAPSTMRDVRSRYEHKQGGGSAYLLAAVTLLVVLFKATLAGAATGSGYSGMWYDPARSGEGLQLEILDANTATVYWFTYDDAGAQRWFGGIGQIAHDAGGDSIQFPDMYVTQGGKFGPSFNPNDVKFQTVGNVSLTFSDCNTGTFKYTAFGQSQTLPIQRLTQTMGAGCQSINGVPGEPVQAYAGQSGNWYDTSHNGEGFDLEWMSNGQAVVSWYTYDTQGNQAWVMGVGEQQNGMIVFDHLFSTSGPKFGTAFDPAKYQEHDWGSLTMTLNCGTGTAHYASTQPGFGSGDFTLTRLTALPKPACPYVQPKFSDLYSVTWDEIPIAASDTITANSIADDGTIAGVRNGHLVLWHPDTQVWEDIPHDLATYAPVFISPDGSSVISVDGPDSGPNNTVLWQRSTGWQVLSSAFSSSTPFAVSKDFKTIVGAGTNTNWYEPVSLWVSPINGDQSVLPTPQYFGLIATAVSDDGNTVLGLYNPSTGNLPWPTIALRWDNGSGPTVMHNPAGDTLAAPAACDSDCNIVFGVGTYNTPDNPYSNEAWYLKSDGGFAYLGTLPDSAGLHQYLISDSTPDGTLAAGLYVAYYMSNNQNQTSRAFIWTQTTGIVSLRSLVADLGIGDDDWSDIDTVHISSNVLNILLGGTYGSASGNQNGASRAVVLQLTPKSPD
jgi:hypothetical protein